MLTFEASAQAPQVDQEHVHIFRLAPPQISPKTVLAHARRLGLKANMKTGTLYQDARQTIYSEGRFKLLAHHASGGMRFCDAARWQVDDGSSHVGFDDDTAIGMAERCIPSHTRLSLADCKVLRVTRLNVGIAEKASGYAEQRVIDIGVVFTRMVDGIAVEGPGGKVMVYLDAQGELTGIDCLWRELGPKHTDRVPLRSAEEVRQAAAREWDAGGSGCVTLDDFRFGYFEQGWDVVQHYLQPAYMLSMTARTAEGEQAIRQSGYLAAAAVLSPEPLLPAHAAAARQARRQA